MRGYHREMPHPATESIRRAFHNDSCVIFEARPTEAGVWDDSTLTYTYPDRTVYFEGPCVLDERAGVRYRDEQQGRMLIQSAEVRIDCPPETVAVGMHLSIDRLPSRVWEIREVSAGSNELTTTLLVQSLQQIPAVQQ